MKKIILKRARLYLGFFFCIFIYNNALSNTFCIAAPVLMPGGTDTLKGKLLFKIDKDSFWNDKEAFITYFNNFNENGMDLNADTGWVMPYSLEIKDSLFYIPSFVDDGIKIYNRKGKCVNSIQSGLDYSTQPAEFFHILPNGHYLYSSSFTHFIQEYDPFNKKTVYNHAANNVFFYNADNNYIFMNHDTLYEKGNSLLPLISKYVYDDNSSLEFALCDSNICIIEMKRHPKPNDYIYYEIYLLDLKGKLLQSFVLDTLNIQKFRRYNVIYLDHDNLLCSFVNDVDQIFLWAIDIKDGRVQYSEYLKNINTKTKPIINWFLGNLLPIGISYKYDPKSQRLYCLETDEDYCLYVYYYDLFGDW